MEQSRLPDGCYACCPWISNLWAEEDRQAKEACQLVSLVENENMGSPSNESMGALSAIYTPDESFQRHPLAWPFWADVESHLQGFPPTVISVNEMDPLRDEGLVFSRKLRRAHVPGHSRIVVGTTHAGDLLCFQTMPDVFSATINDMISFANGLAVNKKRPVCQWAAEAPAAA